MATTQWEADADPTDGRRETPTEKLDRNWNEILQELRVLQTGTQILTGFLLTIPFQQRFADLDAFEVQTYLVVVCFAVVATILALAPVALHRALFRRRAKPQIVDVAHRFMQAALVAVALTLAGTALLIFSVVVNNTVGIVAAVVTALVTLGAWLLMPLGLRARASDRE